MNKFDLKKALNHNQYPEKVDTRGYNEKMHTQRSRLDDLEQADVSGSFVSQRIVADCNSIALDVSSNALNSLKSKLDRF